VESRTHEKTWHNNADKGSMVLIAEFPLKIGRFPCEIRVDSSQKMEMKKLAPEIVEVKIWYKCKVY